MFMGPFMFRCLTAVLGAALVSACSSTAEKPQPAPLPAFTAQLQVQKVWSSKIGEVTTPLSVSVQGTRIALASSSGDLALIDAQTGSDVWRLNLKDRIQAGVGGDGQRFAVVTQNNELVAVESGREIWRQKLQAGTFTAPLVAGGRVFVLTADRTALAFDGASGQRLWAQQRTADPLVLRQAGVLAAWNDTLLVGFEGRLLGLNPLNGLPRWESVVGSSRGTNEVERLVDLVAGLNRQGNSVCARSFQTSVACIDASRGTVQWTRAAQGHTGLDGDEARVYGVESDSKVLAWNRQNGQPAWSEDALRFRGLGAPLVMGKALVIGDEAGLLHFLSRENGKVLQRLSTDSSAVAMRPALAGQTLVVVNRSGQISGYRAE
jgi:outer membrane protein assembly factor BamB